MKIDAGRKKTQWVIGKPTKRTKGRPILVEAAIALVGMVGCWLAAVLVHSADPSIKRYAILALLGALEVYFLVRFIHWAWITPIPFVGS